MRVKKFEAKTMKEALQMVKHELGPDAVILAARDNRKSFGLAGDGSVEVTAAVSENTLHKKKFVESRLRDADRSRFQQSPARMQKQIIDRMTTERLQRRTEEEERRPITSTSYIDIADDEPRGQRRGSPVAGVNGRALRDVIQEHAPEERIYEAGANQEASLPDRAKVRIRTAVKEAWRAGLSTAGAELFGEAPKKDRSGRTAVPRATTQAALPAPVAPAPAEAPSVETEQQRSEINNLKSEISRLQQVLEGFQKVPQNFVGAHPGAEYGISYDLSFMFQKLHEAGIGTENIVEILTRAQNEMDPMQLKKKPLVDAFVARWFLNTIQISAQPSAGRVHCFVGGAGSGKTSSLVKFASQLVVREKKKIAVLTTDSFKVGAADQLKIYCQILNVPFAIVRNAKEWEWVLAQLGHVDHILVDYPGLQLRDMDEIDRLRSLLPPAEAAASFHMVMSATSKDGDAYEIARRYKITDFTDLVFTNLDQSVQHGVIYNLQKKTGRPLHSFGTGTRLPEDFELATKERVLDLIFRLTRIRK